MANSMNKDQFIIDYNKQRNSFIEALKRFNSSKGMPFDHLPEIGGREVDLYHLYQKVTSMGGWHKVTNEQLWERILDDFWLPPACTNAVEVLKHVYFRFLNLYEKVNFLGEDFDSRKIDDEDGPTRKKICLPIESIPLSYNYNQHKVTETQRQQHNLSLELLKRNPYEKLELSLQSGLPNEVDHALNVCVLLSTEGRHTIDLHKANRIIDLMLAHVGVFDDDDICMEDLYSSCWTKHSGRDFLRFWYESVKTKDIRSLITYRGHVYSQRKMAGEEVLNLGRDIGTGDVEGQRVLQMGTFIRNLSFEECNQNILASSSAVFKFLILCLHNTYGNLRQIALDTLANLASEICLISVDDFNTQIILDFIHESMTSQDRFCLVRGVEVLSKMCQTSINKSVLSSHIKKEVYSRLVNLLTIQDIQIIVHSLEALYKLSKAGEPFTTNIAKVHKSIDTLVSFITIEAQSFGPGSLVGIKVVEYVPPASADDRDTVKRPTTVIQPVNPDCINIYQIPSSQLLQPAGSAEPKSVDTPVPKVKKPVTDIQTTTTSWLKATFEPKKKSKVNQVELFSDYLQFCRKFGIDNVLSSAEFLQMVKKIFDQVEIQSINRKNGDKDVFFEGLCKRSSQLPFAVTTIQEDKVSKPISVNVSLQQTPPSTVVTPTLRQRLMEPLRHSIPHQPLHTGSTNLATPKTAENAGRSATQILTNRKSGNVIVAQPLAKGKRKADEMLPHLTNSSTTSKIGNFPNQLTQNGPNLDAISSDASCVKSLLAKKLCQGTSDAISVEVNHSPNNPQNTITSQPFNMSHSPSTFVVCPAVSSNPSNPSHRPLYQQGNSTTVSDIWSSKPAGKSIPSQASNSVSQSTSTVPSYRAPLRPPVALQPSSSTMLNNHMKQSSVVCTVSSSVNEPNYNRIPNPNAQMSNVAPVGMPYGSSVNVSDNNVTTSVSQNCLQNGAGQQGSHSSFVQANNKTMNPSIATSIAHPQHINVQTISQSLQHVKTSCNVVNSSSFPNSGTTVMPQSSNFIPQQIGNQQSLQGSNFITANHQTSGLVDQQQQPTLSQTNPSIALNQVIHAPSNNLQMVGQHQPQTVLAPNMVSIAAGNVTQSIGSPTVAAMLTSSGNHQLQNQAQQQMVISNPMQVTAGMNQPSLGGIAGVPSNVVIQTTPGALVMPSRQVLVQGNVGPVGAVQQGPLGQQPGTVSFVVPQYRQTSSVIIQQSGAVNVLPSLALQPQQPLAQPMPVTQTLTGQVSANLGTRQIFINQSQLPVGMQISSLPGNNGSICLAPQQQQSQQPSNIVIQPNAVLNQPSPPTNLQLTVNGNQVVRNESLSSRSDLANNLNHNQIPLEQQVQGQIQQQQQHQQNQQPNSQLIIQTSHQPQQHQLPVTSLQCNGGSHEVNGVLGSPDSMSSDLPPSPQSTGIQSDILNGQLSDSDSNKSDLAKLVDKSGRPKINGIIHNFENGGFNDLPQQQTLKIPSSNVVSNSLSGNKSETSIHSVSQSVQENLSSNPQIRIISSGPHGTSLSQQLMGVKESTSTPQKIIVNVVQQNRVQQSGNMPVNGPNLQQPAGNIAQQSKPGNVVFQQQQATNTVLQQQQGTNAASQQQQQSKNTVIQRVVVNNSSQRQQHQHPQIIKLIPKHLQKQQNSTNPAHKSVPLTPRPPTRISTLPCPSPSPSPATNTNMKTTQHGSVIIRPSSNSESNSNRAGEVNKGMSSGQATQTTITTPVPKRKAAMVAMVDKTPVRLRRKKDADSSGGSDSQSQTPVSIVLEYKCEWGTCRRNFPSARLVFLHVFRHHIPKTKESCCQWFSCEKLVRKRWSLVSHMQDYHCTEMAMRSACHRRFTLSQNPSAPLPPPPPQPMVYPPDAASQAIRRFAIKPPYPEFAEQREGPVSKHIRLTAALILRNICHHSAFGRNLVARHEDQLNYSCMSRMDSSTALSSCLWDILHYGDAKHKSSSTANHLP